MNKVSFFAAAAAATAVSPCAPATAATRAAASLAGPRQAGAGAASFAAGGGVTLRGTAPTIAQYGTMGIVRVGPNEWAYL